MDEILTTDTVNEVPKTKEGKPDMRTKAAKESQLPHWCMHCKFYVNSQKGRPLMECSKRGGTRQPNDGVSCTYFERKK